MTKKKTTINFPHVTVTAKHALFNEFCLSGLYVTTHSAPLFFTDDGSLVEGSIKAIKAIVFEELDEKELSKQGTDQFIEYIRVQSLAKSEWPFYCKGAAARNIGKYNFTLAPFHEANPL
ncbi:MAG: hypothetical protein HOE65_00070 [Rhodospirillales bacterium]|jgi:hypothetical protein|nr:hypothetical protein [Rhodospirillales bacterium]